MRIHGVASIVERNVEPKIFYRHTSAKAYAGFLRNKFEYKFERAFFVFEKERFEALSGEIVKYFFYLHNLPPNLLGKSPFAYRIQILY